MARVVEVCRGDTDLQRPGLEPVGDLDDPARQARQRAELGEGLAQEAVRLEVALGLGQHQAAGLVLEQGDRIQLRVERAGDRVGLRERLAYEREGGREPNPVAQADPLEVGKRLAGPDGGERAPVVAGQLSPELVCERGLV